MIDTRCNRFEIQKVEIFPVRSDDAYSDFWVDDGEQYKECKRWGKLLCGRRAIESLYQSVCAKAPMAPCRIAYFLPPLFASPFPRPGLESASVLTKHQTTMRKERTYLWRRMRRRGRSTPIRRLVMVNLHLVTAVGFLLLLLLRLLLLRLLSLISLRIRLLRSMHLLLLSLLLRRTLFADACASSCSAATSTTSATCTARSDRTTAVAVRIRVARTGAHRALSRHAAHAAR